MTAPRSPKTPTVVLPGNYDGVHLGHRALIERGRTLAKEKGATVTVLFFDPHPTNVLRPEAALPALTTVTRRRELLLGAGADAVVVRTFDRAFASLSPEAFVGEVLVGELSAVGAVVGPDFRFGQARRGDFAMLTSLGADLGLTAVSVPPVEQDGARVSSSRVREALAKGRVSLATRLLTRVHDVDSVVVRGDQRGRTIGFPTANLRIDAGMLPADGVYAVVARRLAEPRVLWRGVANLGVRPTVNAGRSVEVHLFDVNEDLYDQPLRVGFVAHLRGEQKFPGLDALVAQIQLDAAAARKIHAVTSEELLTWV